ncbi:MAG: RNA methyltransferase [Solobacterium sp.]|nr:RNA methyltransferase [Solobacterium sp.]
MIIEGRISVKAAMLGARREVTAVYADVKKKDRDTAFILAKAAAAGIAVHRVAREEIDAHAQGNTHGGIIAECSGRTYQDLQECLKGAETFAVLAEGVQDPFNFGYIARSLYSAGCTGLIMPERDWTNAESTILRSSAGASEYMNIVMCPDPAQAVRYFRDRGCRCLAAMRKDAVSLYEADLTGPVLIALGGEMRGLSAGVLKETEKNIYIPYANDFRNALNASAAAAVIGFETYRQRSEAVKGRNHAG